MFLKKKAHNLFAKSIKLALKNVRGSVTYVEPDKKEESAEELSDVTDETSKPKRVKPRKNVNEDLVEG